MITSTLSVPPSCSLLYPPPPSPPSAAVPPSSCSHRDGGRDALESRRGGDVLLQASRRRHVEEVDETVPRKYHQPGQQKQTNKIRQRFMDKDTVYHTHPVDINHALRRYYEYKGFSRLVRFLKLPRIMFGLR